MNIKITVLTLACVVALAACGKKPQPPAQDTTPTTAPAATPPPAEAPAATAPAPVAEAPAADARPAAVVSDCATSIEGNDAMQFNVGSITVPASCTEFTINLKHTGQLPVAAMGHNVVIAKASDREAISTEGMAAGVDGHYVKPGDTRVIAHSDLVGGGGTTSVTFPVSRIQSAGPYEFFCSFPSHWAIMRGTIQVG